MTRRISNLVKDDLLEKMVLIAGPRQCGKTTLAKAVTDQEETAYFNWDIQSHRKPLLGFSLPEQKEYWVFDELHKYTRWRNWLKGVYDEHHENHRILVTGSAKLNIFSRGGDSLQGRYFFHRLHPFTVSEFVNVNEIDPSYWLENIIKQERPLKKEYVDALQELWELSGFPEPLFSSSKIKASRWRNQYAQRLIQEDIRDLYRFQNLDLMALLFDRLPETVGSSLTYKRFAFDLEIASETVKAWINAFEQLYSCFRVPPFGIPKIRTVNKEQKLYLWDWGRISDPGPKLENIIAFHLLRFCHYIEDTLGEVIDLRFFRDVDGHEVDFLLIRKRQPWIAIEVKNSEQPLDRGLKYFLERVKCPYAFQLHLKSSNDYSHPKINGTVIKSYPVEKFLSNLP